MLRLRSLIFPALITALVGLAGFGVMQVIIGQESSSPILTPEEAERRSAEFWSRSYDAVLTFADGGGDPCSLAHYESLAELEGPAHQDLPALVNDSELVVAGNPVASITANPLPGAGSGRVLTTFAIDEVLAGASTATTITIDSGQVVVLQGESLARSSIGVPDLCTPGPLLLFLEGAALPDTYRIVAYGYDRIAGDGLDLASFAPAFQGYDNEQAVMDAVPLIAAEQQAQGLLKGLLVCQSKRALNSAWQTLFCPGETANPYVDLSLDLLEETLITTYEPGSRVLRSSDDLASSDSRSLQIFEALDSNVTFQSAGPLPPDALKLRIGVRRDGDLRRYTWSYSPFTNVIVIEVSGSQFTAPDGFQQAMEPFLAAPSGSQE